MCSDVSKIFLSQFLDNCLVVFLDLGCEVTDVLKIGDTLHTCNEVLHTRRFVSFPIDDVYLEYAYFASILQRPNDEEKA
jgi:hypothetical protein